MNTPDQVVITGGCGFLGSALARHISANGVSLPDGTHLQSPEILILDREGSTVPDISCAFHPIDITSENAFSEVITDGTALVYHLAAVVSGQAEIDYELGMSVNYDGTENLLKAIRATGRNIPLVGTSSLAVFGTGMPEPLSEATATQPRSSYGIAKAMSEMLMSDYRRRGWADARCLRMPTVTVRPGAPNAAASSFASGIIREPLNGQPSVLPVDPSYQMWVTSPDGAVSALVHAAAVPTVDWPVFSAINVPGIVVSMTGMLDALEAVAGLKARVLVTNELDPAIQAIAETWPFDLDCSLALSLGFGGDETVAGIISQAQRDCI